MDAAYEGSLAYTMRVRYIADDHKRTQLGCNRTYRRRNQDSSADMVELDGLQSNSIFKGGKLSRH